MLHQSEYYWHTVLTNMVSIICSNDLYSNLYSYTTTKGRRDLTGIFNTIPEDNIKESLKKLTELKKLNKTEPIPVRVTYNKDNVSIPSIIVMEEAVNPVQQYFALGNILNTEVPENETDTETFVGPVLSLTLKKTPYQDDIEITASSAELTKNIDYTITDNVITFTSAQSNVNVDYSYQVSNSGVDYGFLNSYTVRIIINAENRDFLIFLTMLIYALLMINIPTYESVGIRNLTISRETGDLFEEIQPSPGFKKTIILEYTTEETMFIDEELIRNLTVTITDDEKDLETGLTIDL